MRSKPASRTGSILHRSRALLAAVTLAVAGCADAGRPPIERVSGTRCAGLLSWRGRVDRRRRSDSRDGGAGPAGDPRSEARTFENPVVAFVEGQWRVADYRFDGDSIIHHPSTSSASVGGIDLRLLGALSLGKSTAIVTDLTSDADHGIRLDNEKITYAGGTTAQPTLGALSSQKPAALYFLFDRVSLPPTSWSSASDLTGSVVTHHRISRVSHHRSCVSAGRSRLRPASGSAPSTRAG